MKSALFTILLASSIALHAGDDSVESVEKAALMIDGFEAAKTIE